jgi:hypothetical protein
MEMSQGNSLYSYLKQKSCHFLQNWRAEHVMSGGLVPVCCVEYKERMQEGEYGGNTMYSCM